MKITVLTPLITSPVPRHYTAPWLKKNSTKSQLVGNFIVKIICNDDKEIVITVPKNYISDWSSIPRLFWFIYPPNYSEARRPAIVHDYICSHMENKIDCGVSADIFKEFLVMEGASKTSVFFFYNAVRFYNFLKHGFMCKSIQDK